MCFYLAMLFRSNHELPCFLSAFILSKSSPSSGLMFVQLVLHSNTRFDTVGISSETLFMFQLFGRPQWMTVKSRSQSYVMKVQLLFFYY